MKKNMSVLSIGKNNFNEIVESDKKIVAQAVGVTSKEEVLDMLKK